MKKLNVLISIGIIALLVLSWGSLISKNIKNNNEYKNLIEMAENSLSEQLYEQAIEFYRESLSYKESKETYLKIKDTYEIYYKEEPSAYVRSCYISDMEQAAIAYPKQEEFWLTQMKLYMDIENDKEAFGVAKQALNRGVESTEIDDIYQKLLYKVKLDYKLYADFKTCLNGFITVNDGNGWLVLDGTGEEYSNKYEYIGLINGNGRGIYVNGAETRLLDSYEVTRARFDVEIEEAGYFSESSGYVPVRINGVWKYMNENGEYLNSEYEEAGCFYNQKAAVKKNNEWFLIDDAGNAYSEKFEDIKLDLYGSYVQADVILAKVDGKYHIYNTEWEKIDDFSCDDIDICIDNNLIAFKQNEKWGYVDTEGNIVIEPQYANAKSFSNGMAAVCDANGYWGFINSEYELVIGYEYLEAHYFNSNEVCVVSDTEDTYQLLKFVFE